MKTYWLFKVVLISIFVLLIVTSLTAQDSTRIQELTLKDSIVGISDSYTLKHKHFIIPSILIGFGVVSLWSDGLKELNSSTRDEINEHQPDHISFDNFSQYAPAALVYSLNALGLKGKHDFRYRTIIYATSQLLAASFVLPLKHLVKEQRPDGSNALSFPSGHTTTAFSSAQFMFREYKDNNFWIGISGYSFAVFTGIYRTINDRHWVGDVVAGAGFGILSTELSYWLHPKINNLFAGRKKKTNTMLLPTYNNKAYGFSLVKIY